VGTLVYGDDGLNVDFDDRTLRHLEIVIRLKLRRDQPFCLNWTEQASPASLIRMLWICDQVSLSFVYRSERLPVINTDWIRAMCGTADEPAGLVLRNEPGVRRFWPRRWQRQF
jgi:hypothetical protein